MKLLISKITFSSSMESIGHCASQALHSFNSVDVKHHFLGSLSNGWTTLQAILEAGFLLPISPEKPKSFSRKMSFQNSELLLYPYFVVHWRWLNNILPSLTPVGAAWFAILSMSYLPTRTQAAC